MLERYGQGGNCERPGPSYYHNSFIIADPGRAFVLETIGRDWMVEQVDHVRSISNCYSIAAPDRMSGGLTDQARRLGWRAGAAEGLATLVGSNEGRVHASAQRRSTRSLELLARAGEAADTACLFRVLRDHGAEGEGQTDWRPSLPRRPNICSHSSDLEPRGQTTGSLVSELRPGRQLHWVTAGPAPCLAIFKPLFVDCEAPPALASRCREDSTAFWRGQDALHRRLLDDPEADLAAIRRERDALEAGFLERVEAVADAHLARRQGVVDSCWNEAAVLEARWRRALAA